MIRNGEKEDLAQIEAFDEFGGDRENEVSNKCLKVYILENKVVGYISVIDESCLCGHPLILFLCVHPAYRLRGIASELLSEVEHRYIDQRLFVSTESNNSAMLSLIQKRGYLLSGSLSGLNDDGSDEIYFYKN